MDRQYGKESGFTLVLGLVFILVASMSGVALMRGSVMQEQMTSNMNHKAISFMAAEAGANILRANLIGWPASVGSLRGLSGSVGRNGNFEVLSISGGGTVPVVADIVGRAVQGNEILGVTNIRVEFGMASLGLPAAITFADNVTGFSPAQSANFFIDGNGRPAMATQTSSSMVRVDNGVGDRKGGGKDPMCVSPCVAVKEFGAPWGDANQLMAFLDGLRGNENVNFIDGKGSKKLEPDKKITVFEGGASLTGGNAPYEGVIVILGDNVDLKGLGNSDIRGAVYIANVVGQAGDYSFGDLSVSITGGGNALIAYDSSAGSSIMLPAVLDWRETIGQ